MGTKFKAGDRVRRVRFGPDATAISYTWPVDEIRTVRDVEQGYFKVIGSNSPWALGCFEKISLDEELVAAKAEVKRIEGLITERDAPKVGQLWRAKINPVGKMKILQLLEVFNNHYIIAVNTVANEPQPIVIREGSWIRDYEKL